VKALVTGAGGFLAQYIIEQLLARGDVVRGFARSPQPQLESLGVEVVRGDIRDPQAVSAACSQADVVFHTAAVAAIAGRWDYFYSVNTLGTENVLTGCREQAVPRLVYTSSPSVVFDGTDQKALDESAPYASRWLCHYPHSKALGEQRALAANGRNGLLTCALRPHLMWGPRDQHLIPSLLNRARRGRLVRVGAGDNLIDAVYVEYAARAHLLAADHLRPNSPVAGHTYFITNGEPVNCWDWINQILTLTHLPPVERSISFRTAWWIGAVMEATWKALRLRGEPLMTRFLAAQLATSHYFDISRARHDLGYQPQISMMEGMRRLVAWFKTTNVS